MMTAAAASSGFAGIRHTFKSPAMPFEAAARTDAHRLLRARMRGGGGGGGMTLVVACVRGVRA